MKHTYEIAVLYHPSLEVDLGKAEDQVGKIIKNNGGEITETENWGKRKLAYPIKKQEHAVYVFYTVKLPADKVGKLESTLNITSEVIRFLITKIDPKLSEIKAAKAEKAARKEKRSSENGGEQQQAAAATA